MPDIIRLRILFLLSSLALLGMGCGDDTQDTITDTVMSVDDTSTTDTRPPPDTTVTDTDAANADADVTPVELSEASIARADEVDSARYQAAVEFIADVRAPGSAHWQAVQDRCADVFEDAGFTVERHDYGTGVNVIGVLPGTTLPDEFVVVSAHYDHVPGCEGADDNASGTAGVLEAAQILGGDHLYARTLVVACWDQEEGGLVGAEAWAARAARQGKGVHASYVLETIAYHDDAPNTQYLPMGFAALFPEPGAFVAEREDRGDFIAAIGDDINTLAIDELIAHSDRVELPVARVVLNESFRTGTGLADLRRSDHDAFWQQGWPAIMLTDTANFRNPNYHCTWGQDRVADLDLGFALKVVQATIGAAANQAQPVTEGTRAVIDTTTDPNPPPPPPCDLIQQTGCDAAQKCALVFEATPPVVRCADAEGSLVGLNETCGRPTGVAGLDDCVASAFCAFWQVPESDPQTRICHAMCASDAACEAGEVCIRLNDASSPVGLCTPGCDPRDPAAVCPDGTYCELRENINPGHDSFYCIPGSYSDAPEGETCQFSRCQAGLSCVPEVGGREQLCVAYCDTDADCSAGHACVALGTDPASGAPFGRCIPPL